MSITSSSGALAGTLSAADLDAEVRAAWAGYIAAREAEDLAYAEFRQAAAATRSAWATYDAAHRAYGEAVGFVEGGK